MLRVLTWTLMSSASLTSKAHRRLDSDSSDSCFGWKTKMLSQRLLTPSFRWIDRKEACCQDMLATFDLWISLRRDLLSIALPKETRQGTVFCLCVSDCFEESEGPTYEHRTNDILGAGNIATGDHTAEHDVW